MSRRADSVIPSDRPGEVHVSEDASRGVEIRDLRVVYATDDGELPAVYGVDMDLPPGTITGLVGESGSGKSTLALSMLNAVQKPGRITDGSIRLPTVDNVLELEGKALRRARGQALGYAFQASQNSLNPLKRVGAQLLDLGRSHGYSDRKELLDAGRQLCEQMGLDPVRVLSAYPHELSGGMRQRVGIVFALVLNARVLVLDEPTTALDMLSQAAVLEIITEIHHKRDLVTLIITHDIAIVGDIADRLAVMYGGRLVETGPTRRVLQDPRHPYTRGLIAAMPRISGDIEQAQPLQGRPPNLRSIATEGCAFRDRCPLAIERCSRIDPPLVTIDGDSALTLHAAACHVMAPAVDEAMTVTSEEVPK